MTTPTAPQQPLPLPAQASIRRIASTAHINAQLRQLIEAGELAAAESVARQSLDGNPTGVEATYVLGYILYQLGRPTEAIDCFRRATELHPYLRSAWDNMVNVLSETGRLAEALAAAFELEKHMGGATANRFRIGTLHLRRGDHTAARTWLDRALNSIAPEPNTRLLPYGTVTLPRLIHDESQLGHLIDCDILDDSYRRDQDEYRRLLRDAISRKVNLTTDWQLQPTDLLTLTRFYRRVLHLADGSQLSGHAVNPRLDWSALERSYLEQPDPFQIIVVDNLLTRPAWQALLKYCLDSTIWHNDAQKGRNYLGAHQGNGFSCQLVEQIADELRAAVPGICRDLPLSQVWAYRHVTGSPGIGVHADFAVVNVNLWITPDEANLDRSSGGMVVYHSAARKGASFDEYNDDDASISEAIRNTGQRLVSYRQNRAVIFNSRLYHGSDRISFRPDYASRRINVTFLFGER